MINSHKPSVRFYRHSGSRDNEGNDGKFLPRCIVKSKFQDRRDGKEKKRKEGGRAEEEKKGDKKEENKRASFCKGGRLDFGPTIWSLGRTLEKPACPNERN